MVFLCQDYRFGAFYTETVVAAHLDEKFFTENVNFLTEALFAFKSNSCDLPHIHFPKIELYFRTRYSEKNPIQFLFHLLMLERIAKRRPFIYTAKQSVAAFSLRKGIRVGAKVTLADNEAFCFLLYFVRSCIVKSVQSKVFFSSTEKVGVVTFSVKDIYMFPELDLEFQKWVDFVPPSSVSFQISISSPFRGYLGSLVFLSHFEFPLL